MVSAQKLSQDLWRKEILIVSEEVESIMYNDPNAAKKLLDHTLDRCRREQLYELLPGLTNLEGDVYFLKGDIEKSMVSYQNANELAEEHHNKLETGNSLMGMGNCWDQKENYDEALKYYYQALNIRQTIEDVKGISEVYNNLGRLHYFLNDTEKAIEFLNYSVHIDRQLNDLDGLGYSYSNLGAFYGSLGDTEKALDYELKALKIRLEVGNKLEQAHSYNNVANVLLDLGKTKSALKYYSMALKLKKEIGNPIDIAVTLNNIGETYLDYDTVGTELLAYAFLKEAERYLSGLPVTYNYYDNQLYLAQTYQRLDSVELAYTYMSRYYQVRDSLRLLKKHVLSDEIPESISENRNTSSEVTVSRNYLLPVLLSVILIAGMFWFIIRRKRRG